MDLFHSTAFGTYALFATTLCILLVTIDIFGGNVRTGTKTTPNVEDQGTIAKGADVVEADPDGVARVMRAHRNALANIVPFLLVMLLYVALGASTQWVIILCGIFTVLRVAHAITYIGGIQPWRTVSFIAGQLCLFIAMAQVVRAAFAVV